MAISVITSLNLMLGYDLLSKVLQNMSDSWMLQVFFGIFNLLLLPSNVPISFCRLVLLVLVSLCNTLHILFVCKLIQPVAAIQNKPSICSVDKVFVVMLCLKWPLMFTNVVSCVSVFIVSYGSSPSDELSRLKTLRSNRFRNTLPRCLQTCRVHHQTPSYHRRPDICSCVCKSSVLYLVLYNAGSAGMM